MAKKNPLNAPGFFAANVRSSPRAWNLRISNVRTSAGSTSRFLPWAFHFRRRGPSESVLLDSLLELEPDPICFLLIL